MSEPDISHDSTRHPAYGANAPTVSPDSCELLHQLGLGVSHEPTAFPTHGTSVAKDDLPTIPGYDVIAEIARGGMGRILAAREHTLGREVAIKVLLPEVMAGHAVARFVRESRITSRLPHPNIPPIHALGTLADGNPFLVMKRIHGRTLAEVLANREGKQPGSGGSPDLLVVFEQVCQAVGFAHERGFIHRDLKPQNVMVGDYGEVQVMDWGLSKEMRNAECGTGNEDDEGESDLPSIPHSAFRIPHSEETHAGAVLGTPAFMSPEQARGLGHDVDQRSDVFSLGGILCAILTGAPPYTGRTTADVLRKAFEADSAEGFARLDTCGADADLVALAKHCMAPRKADRPADAGEVTRLVAAHRANVEERLRTAEREFAAAAVRAVEERRRKRTQFALAAAVALILVGLAAGAWWNDRQAKDRKAEQARVEAEKNADALQRQIEAGRLASAERDRLNRNAQAIELLIAQCERSIRDENPGGAAGYLAEIDRRLHDGGGNGLAAHVAQCRADLTLLQELERIDDYRWTSIDGRLPDTTKVGDRWAEAFRKYGLVPGQTPGPDALARLERSLIKDRILMVLDLWLVAERKPELLAFLCAADPDAFRNDVRSAVAANDATKIQLLAERPESLKQPPRFAVPLGRLDTVRMERRRLILEGALRGRPNNFQVLMTLGGLYQFNQEEGSANRVRWYQAAAAVRPGDAAVYIELALALCDFKDDDAAMNCYREVFRIDPNHAVAHNNFGNGLRGRGDLSGAIRHLKEAVRLSPKWATARSNLGVALLENEEPDEALVHFREAVQLDPGYASPRFNIGRILEQRGDREGAAKEYLGAIRANPNHAPSHTNLATYYWDTGKREQAIAELREAIRCDRKSAFYRNNLGNALFLEGDYDGAIAEYRAAVALEPKYASPARNLELALQRKADREERIAPLPREVKR